MNWRCRVVRPQVFPDTPLDEPANYCFQRHVTPTYPRSLTEFATVVGIAPAQVANVCNHWPGALNHAIAHLRSAGPALGLPGVPLHEGGSDEANVDPAASVHSFLQYSDQRWTLYNPGLQWQNRRRHREYLVIIVDVGFEVLDDKHTQGTPQDLAVLAGLPVHQRYRADSPVELAVRDSLLVLRAKAS